MRKSDTEFKIGADRLHLLTLSQRLDLGALVASGAGWASKNLPVAKSSVELHTKKKCFSSKLVNAAALRKLRV